MGYSFLSGLHVQVLEAILKVLPLLFPLDFVIHAWVSKVHLLTVSISAQTCNVCAVTTQEQEVVN